MHLRDKPSCPANWCSATAPELQSIAAPEVVPERRSETDKAVRSCKRFTIRPASPSVQVCSSMAKLSILLPDGVFILQRSAA